MITRLYSVFDSISGEYGPLFQAKNDEVALRNVIQMFTDMHVCIMSLECSHLFHVGDFDTELGSFVSVNPNDEIDIDFAVLDGVFDAYDAYKSSCDGVFDAYKSYCDGLKKTKEDK